MTRIRLDKVTFTTLFEAPKNYDKVTGNISISGSVPAGGTSNFSTSLPYTRSGTRADVYLDGNNRRVSANSGSRASSVVYSFKATETFSIFVSYSTSAITVTASIFNGAGSPITLNSQTIQAIAVLIDAPIGSL